MSDLPGTPGDPRSRSTQAYGVSMICVRRPFLSVLNNPLPCELSEHDTLNMLSTPSDVAGFKRPPQRRRSAASTGSLLNRPQARHARSALAQIPLKAFTPNASPSTSPYSSPLTSPTLQKIEYVTPSPYMSPSPLFQSPWQQRQQQQQQLQYEFYQGSPLLPPLPGRYLASYSRAQPQYLAGHNSHLSQVFLPEDRGSPQNLGNI
jgi:hypothetical protein